VIEQLIRVSAFIGVFGLVTLPEVLAPRRSQTVGRPPRWLVSTPAVEGDFAGEPTRSVRMR
jgi:hypothetical protein